MSISARASPRGATTAGPKLHQLAGILVEAEADAQPLAFPGAGDRQHDIGEGGGRASGRDRSGREIRARAAPRRRAPRRRATAAGWRRTRPARAPGRAAPSMIARYKIIGRIQPDVPSPSGRSASPSALRHCRRIAQLDARDVVDRHLGEMQIAARRRRCCRSARAGSRSPGRSASHCFAARARSRCNARPADAATAVAPPRGSRRHRRRDMPRHGSGGIARHCAA